MNKKHTNDNDSKNLQHDMKYLIILGDGMADEPIAALGDKTPLQAAATPTMDYLAKMGRCGMLHTVPKGFHPGSEVAHLSLLGYNLPEVFEGRGSLEAASMGIPIMKDEMAMRVNLVCLNGDKIKNHSAGDISTEEAKELIDALNRAFDDTKVKLYPGFSYRHLLIMKGGDKRLNCTPPHDVPGQTWADKMVQAAAPEAEETAKCLNDLILRSQKILANHPVNLRRVAEGKDPANSIWPWSPGYRPHMQTLLDTYGFRNGAVISAVDLIKGIGVYAGLQVIEVPGATGLWDTNYEGKAQAAIEALKTNDFVFLHVEATDEAGHAGDPELKTRAVEYLENRVVKPIWEALQKTQKDDPVAIAILPDHPTFCRTRTHSEHPVPFLIYRPDQRPDKVQRYDEESCREGAYGELYDAEFMNALTHTSSFKVGIRKMRTNLRRHFSGS